MFMISSPLFLRRTLLADAIASAAAGLLMALGAGLLAPLFGLPVMLLREAGIVLLPFAALAAWVATRSDVPRRGVWTIIACNAVWVLDSAALLLSGWVSPTVTGQAFILAQAGLVALFAEMEYLALRKLPASLAY